MNWLKRLVTAVKEYFRSGRAERDMDLAVMLIEPATRIVKRIAELTANRTDDELIAVFERYAVPFAAHWLHLPKEKRGRALMDVAATELKRYAPDAADRVIDLAVQLAYTGYRAEANG